MKRNALDDYIEKNLIDPMKAYLASGDVVEFNRIRRPFFDHRLRMRFKTPELAQEAYGKLWQQIIDMHTEEKRINAHIPRTIQNAALPGQHNVITVEAKEKQSRLIIRFDGGVQGILNCESPAIAEKLRKQIQMQLDARPKTKRITQPGEGEITEFTVDKDCIEFVVDGKLKDVFGKMAKEYNAGRARPERKEKPVILINDPPVVHGENGEVSPRKDQRWWQENATKPKGWVEGRN